MSDTRTITSVQARRSLLKAFKHQRPLFLWGSQLCQVVFAPAQFSWTLSPIRTVWSQQQMVSAKQIAINLVQGVRVRSLDSQSILHYHANYVRPRWGNKNNIVAVAGPHIFYRDIEH